MTSKHLLIIVLAIGIVLPAAIVCAAPLPEWPPPPGFASVNGPNGGRTLAGTFSGNARSAAAVLGGMLGALRGYFDGAPSAIPPIAASWPSSMRACRAPRCAAP